MMIIDKNPMAMLGIMGPKNQEKYFNKYKVNFVYR